LFALTVFLLCFQIVRSQPAADSGSKLTLLLFGDVNLGRKLGQELLKGNVDYPLSRMSPILRSADAVFVNLESPITDQNGETESPTSNFIFCAPPAAAVALRKGGVTIVSTANNHAFDYSVRGLVETIQNLDKEWIRHVGTSIDSVRHIRPVVLRRHGIRVGFLAYTQFINAAGPWQGRIAVFDSLLARRDIQLLKRKTDLVIVSFHGGTEYAQEPDAKTRRQMQSLVNAGADIVIGHHPHVPQGIDILNGKLIFYSLGNFIFNQSTDWAKRSFGVEVKVVKHHRATVVAGIRLIPIRAYKQPSADLTRSEIVALTDRLQKLSTASIVSQNDSLFVTLPYQGRVQ